MTLEEFELKVEAQTETTNLDYKANMAWDVKSFAKDFIAMSNLRDPAFIIIGIREEGTGYIREGVSEENRETYKIDIMKDQLMSCTDPAVDFQVFFFKDSDDKHYVVIKVAPFKDIPIISKKDFPGKLNANTLYYRNTNKCVESAPISNSTDFRELIELAAIKLMQKRKSFGYHINASINDALDKEIEGINDDGVIAKIKSQGYWEVTFRPSHTEQPRSIQQYYDLLKKSTVRLGGWELPYIPPGQTEIGGVYTGQNFYEIRTDWGARKEFMRIYKSGQILFYRALVEDWYADDTFRSALAIEVSPGSVLNLFYSLTYFVTEILEFLARLGENGLYKDGVNLKMALHHTKNRKLRMDDSKRNGFSYDRITLSPSIEINKELDISNVITDGVSIANEIIIEIMDAFGFNREKEAVMNDQKLYIEGKV